MCVVNLPFRETALDIDLLLLNTSPYCSLEGIGNLIVSSAAYGVVSSHFTRQLPHQFTEW